MNFKELNDWAINIVSKNNANLIALGVKSEKISKVRSILKDGISVRCKMIIANTEKNNIHINQIEEDIKQLSEYGLSFAKEPETSINTKSSIFNDKNDKKL